LSAALDALPPELGERDAREQVFMFNLASVRDNGDTVAMLLHKEAGGVVEVPRSSNHKERAVVELAVQSYPFLLLPPEEWALTFPGRVHHVASVLLHTHPANREMQDAVQADTQLAELFGEPSEHTGSSTGMIFRSTGRGSSVQLWGLPSLVIASAWRSRTAVDEAPTVSDFAAHALRRWHVIRKALLGSGPRLTDARVALTGVRLPDRRDLDFGDVLVRPPSRGDEQYVPHGLAGELTSTDADGKVTTIDYAGDVVAQFSVPYAAKIVPTSDSGDSDTMVDFPPGLVDVDSVERVIRRLRISLLLASSDTSRAPLLPTWRAIDDPLEEVTGVSWSDPRLNFSLRPTSLTPDEVSEWQQWYGWVGAPGADRLAVAMTRVLRASAERTDLVDVLIDSVIAWENIFGSSEGEPTLRVTASIARLLESEPARRSDLQRRLAKIYGLRSRAVHGNPVKASEYELCSEALEIAIRVLRTLLDSRRDLLQKSSGTERSLQLLVE
jgi:hypothetical protein